MPTDGRAMTALGDALVKLGRVDEAIPRYRTALEFRPIFAQTYRGLGAALGLKGETDEAIELLLKAVEMDPQLATAHRYLGQLYVSTQRIDEGLAAFERALEGMPDNAQWRREYAAALLAKKDEAAIEQYEEAIRLDPNNAFSHTGYARACRQFGRLDEVVASYQRAIELEPERVGVYDALGLVLQETGDVGEAISVYHRGLGIAPENPRLANNLAWILATTPEATLRNGVEAVRLATQASERANHRNPNFLDSLAAAQAELGQFDEALETIERAIELAQARGFTELASRMQERRQLYASGKPYRSSS
jgi:tetratricopeptide (TPR) repeat protein